MVGVRVTGSNKKLQELIGQMRRVSSTLNKVALHRELAAIQLKHVKKGFEKSVTPYGQKWKKLKYRNGKPLVLTGALRDSVKVFANSKTFGVRTDLVYAATHNYGRIPIPRRQFMPTDGIPASVADQMRRLTINRLKKAGLR